MPSSQQKASGLWHNTAAAVYMPLLLSYYATSTTVYGYYNYCGNINTTTTAMLPGII